MVTKNIPKFSLDRSKFWCYFDHLMTSFRQSGAFKTRPHWDWRRTKTLSGSVKTVGYLAYLKPPCFFQDDILWTSVIALYRGHTVAMNLCSLTVITSWDLGVHLKLPSSSTKYEAQQCKVMSSPFLQQKDQKRGFTFSKHPLQNPR